ncbi:unnamed protein product [Sphenostylis stenocarpa]|uniref:Uncharacterized protein n=1 Tax=Sphenostylis stenocarpa TaxID=92480 RepID=A0AA86S0G6_9FABA|nr:unnamed protein product [Sphenostylis stenocarpa]
MNGADKSAQRIPIRTADSILRSEFVPINMAPKKSIPLSRKRKGEASSSRSRPAQSPPHEEPAEREGSLSRLDCSKFLNRAKKQRYEELEPRIFLCERRVELGQGEPRKNVLGILAAPPAKFKENIVREFYANAYARGKTDQERMS